MKAEEIVDLSNGESVRFILKEETHKIIGFAMEALNSIGHGFYEKIYENAIVVDCKISGISYQQQLRHDILYKNHPVGFYIPDLIVYNQIVVDAKTIDKITDIERGKMLNYLKITKLRVGLILNFKNPKLEFERIVR